MAGMLCFVLDLPTFSATLLRDLKQSLLQLANLYAISAAGPPPDRLALCYLHRTTLSSSLQLNFAYIPRGNFSLRDFHHAVTNLPSDGYSPESAQLTGAGKGALETAVSKLFRKDALYSWGGSGVVRKVIYITSYLEGKIDDAKKTLVHAAEQLISLEFMLMEQDLDQLVGTHERVQEFSNSISDLENCILRKCLPDIWVLCGLVKKWLHEVKDDGVSIHQGVFLFKNTLARSVNHIFCRLSPTTCPIIDGFNPCKACRCHGLQIGNSKSSPPSCPVTNVLLESQNLVDNAISIGEHTILFLPSFENISMPSKISSPIPFKITMRTSLASLTEALFMGASYFVTPSACHEMEGALEEQDNSEINCQIFHGISRALHNLDEGLVCSSYCNMDTMKETTLQCFYLLQPSDKGQMLLRRMAGSEEALPLPNGIVDVQVPNDIEASLQASLLKMEARDYNPLLNERGLHPKINNLVKESLHFGSIPKFARPELSNSTNPMMALPAARMSDNYSEADYATVEDSSASITKEWEQLIVHEVRGYSQTCIMKSTVEKTVQSPEVRPLDEKTSRILERLEVPKSQKVQCSSPATSYRLRTEITAPTKKPLLPFDGNSMNDSGPCLSQPMKPVFGKLRRKQK